MEQRRRRSRWVTRSAAGIALGAVLIGCDAAQPPDPVSDAQDAAPAAPPGFLAPADLGLLLGPWRPDPVPLWPMLLDAVAGECARSMQPFPAAPLVAVDARGGGRMQALFVGPGGQAACYDMTVDATGAVRAIGGGMTATGPAGPPLDANGLQSAGVSSSGDGANVIRSSVITGRAGAGIAIVAIKMPGRPRMTATLANGWYLFWWPGALPAETRVIGLDGSGGEVAQADP